MLRVRGRGSGRVSMASMTCYKVGVRSRLFYTVRECTGRKDQPKGFGWRDCGDLAHPSPPPVRRPDRVGLGTTFVCI